MHIKLIPSRDDLFINITRDLKTKRNLHQCYKNLGSTSTNKSLYHAWLCIKSASHGDALGSKVCL